MILKIIPNTSILELRTINIINSPKIPFIPSITFLPIFILLTLLKSHIQSKRMTNIQTQNKKYDDNLGGETLELTENGRKVLIDRYLRKGEDGKPTESIEEMYMRIARHIAQVESMHGDDVNKATDTFYRLLTEFRFSPNSPTFTGAGTPLGQLAACFVLPISDDLGKESDGIFQTLRDAALIQQTGGGNGFSFSRLRPKGDTVRGSAGVASGPVSFLRAYDTAFGVIAQGGTRRGANMGVLRVDHPDIYEFISCKAKEGEIANFNISVAITDEFMRAVEEDKMFELVNPRTKEVTKVVRARELFDEIIKYAHLNGEPGALFIDRANETNPVPHLYTLEATNPCGEQWLGPYENCCLGSINLARHVKNGAVDWEALQRTIEESTHFLDNVVSANNYVPAVPQLREAALRVRRIGLGIMGLADMMYMLGIRYGSNESLEFASQMMEFIRYHAMRKSIELAKTRGAFPAIKGSIYDKDNFRWQIPTPLVPYTKDWGRPRLDWEAIRNDILTYGIRNGAQTTIAPTGTIATVVGCEGYGCEPVFALAYTRYVIDHKTGDRTQLQYVSPLFQKAIDASNLSHDVKQQIIQRINEEGTCQNIEELPENIRDTFVVASDIAGTEHVMMQAALQRFVDNSISKTINFPEGTTQDEVKNAYFLAWKNGCKGITVYVAGTRQVVVLETKKTAKQKEEITNTSPNSENTAETIPANNANIQTSPISVKDYQKPRPSKLKGETIKITTPLGKGYVTINQDENGDPFEVFLNIGKGGSDLDSISEAFGRLITFILRSNSGISQKQKIMGIIEELKDIGGSKIIGFGNGKVKSLPDAIAKALKEYFDEHYSNVNHQETSGNQENDNSYLNHEPKALCTQCGEYAVVEMEGCNRCLNCGHSEC